MSMKEPKICRVCKLYKSGAMCKTRRPTTLPVTVCCAECKNTNCENRCRNTPEKCGAVGYMERSAGGIRWKEVKA